MKSSNQHVFHDEKLGADYKYDGSLGGSDSEDKKEETEEANSSREFDPEILN